MDNKTKQFDVNELSSLIKCDEMDLVYKICVHLAENKQNRVSVLKNSNPALAKFFIA
jgi:hypothetical protein